MNDILGKKSQAAVTKGGSALARYQDVMVGKRSLLATVYYEWCSWLSILPGAVGMVMRKIFWPRMFGACGKGVVFGQNIVVRHPHRIRLGNRVVISESCILDARSDMTDNVITIKDDVILSNNVMISCKGGTAEIGSRSGLGTQTVIQSILGCPVSIGEDVMIGPQCYLVGGSNYNTDRLDIPMWKQGIKQDEGIMLENDIWIGGKVSILGGCKIGNGSIVAAGAVVTKSFPVYSVCVGMPARLLKKRG